MTIQDLGWKARGLYNAQASDIASTTFWYQTEPHAPFPKLPSADELVMRHVYTEKPPRIVKLPPTAILFEDFEKGYGKWKVTGEAFGPGPARGTLADQNPVDGYSGRFLVNTFFQGDDTKGTLTSPAFTIEKPFINFLVGGGNYKDQTCVNLVVDGKTVRTVTGKNAERLEWTHWDVREFKGQTAMIVIVDDRTGHFGHINADSFYFDDSPHK